MAPTSAWEEKIHTLDKLFWRFTWACLKGSPSPADFLQAIREGSRLQLLVLDLLQERDPMYGYEIVTALCAQYPDKRDRLMYGHLYPVFEILTTCGLLRKERRPPPPGRGPYRVYYRLTTLGHSIFPDQQ